MQLAESKAPIVRVEIVTARTELFAFYEKLGFTEVKR